ncbi:aldose epimerase family protein [Stakelama tenebrarum]|uniref:Aldose 1-epimerase n=1 Tax=Stakelama tenebrarum TaxID=2711215 RepID=A0A6G6Y5P4_9SPHN|nr:aldose epimerase family protein [Sphingosinithalassobacter tenebrarum]QIG80219.1 galactose mutarotase [Sphingosinithalassobacter tenebrarum]
MKAGNSGMLALAMLSATGWATGASAASAERGTFGTLDNGTTIESVTLRGDNGVSVRIITLGATLQAFEAPDRNGDIADITLGYDDPQSYLSHPNYWGQTIGRYANRIGGGRFTLDDAVFQLTLNNGTASLHGGTEGWDIRVWKIEKVEQGPVARVVLSLTSPDGDQGYPGTVQARVTYALDDQGELTIDFDATTDAPTVINMTNHALFDLGGEGSDIGTLKHRLTIPASRYTPVDEALIPTGELRPVEGSVFDFREGRVLADGIRDGSDEQIVLGRGYDHNFVLDKGRTDAPELVARLEDPASGRVLEVLSTEPGLQFYSGNFLDGTLIGKNGHLYRMGDGIALEPQLFPDTPNQPSFGTARVDPGETYHHRMIYRVSVAR